MKQMSTKKHNLTFRFRGRIYRLSKKGMIVLGVSLALVIGLIAALAVALHPKKTAEADAAASADAGYNASEGVIDKTAYSGAVLEETDDAGRSYVDGTLFLGDSNTARFLKYDDTDGKTFTSKQNTIGVVAMGIDAISSLKCMEFSGTGLVAMPQAVKILQPERVIITFGTNNLSGTGTDASDFITRYTAQIKTIVEAYPSVDIIVNAIPPVAKNRAYPNVTMTQIDAYNKGIVQMCKDNNWKFLDSSEVLKDSTTGYAKEGYMASDGLHLSQTGLETLFKYIRTHSYITDDDRPKPLTAIPTVVGVPDNLIQTNPLATDGASNVVPVEFTAAAGGYLNGSTSQSIAVGATSGAVTAVANEGYTFSYWQSSNGQTYSTATITVTVPEGTDANGLVLTAYFSGGNTATEATTEEETTPDCTEGQTVNGCACKMNTWSNNTCHSAVESTTPDCTEGQTVNGCACKMNTWSNNTCHSAVESTIPDCADGATISGCNCKFNTWSNNTCNIKAESTSEDKKEDTPTTSDPSTGSDSSSSSTENKSPDAAAG